MQRGHWPETDVPVCRQAGATRVCGHDPQTGHSHACAGMLTSSPVPRPGPHHQGPAALAALTACRQQVAASAHADTTFHFRLKSSVRLRVGR